MMPPWFWPAIVTWLCAFAVWITWLAVTAPKGPPPMTTRICRHVLRIATHVPAWLACDTCHADFLHREDCPGLGTPGCARDCMGGADPEVAALDALFSLPAAQGSDHR